MAKLKIKESWDLSPLYKNDNDPQIVKDRKTVEAELKKFISKWQKNQKYLASPKILAQALIEYEKLFTNWGIGNRETYYYGLRSSLDQLDPKIKAKESKATDFAYKNLNDIQFFELNISKIDPKLQQQLLKDKSLQKYKHFLEKLFKQGKHLLSDAEEKIMNLKSKPAYSNWVSMVSQFLSKEEREIKIGSKKSKKTFEELMTLTSDPDKKVRSQAADALEDIFKKYEDVATEELNSVLENKKIDDQLRGYSRPDESRHISDDIETEIIDNLLESVSKKYALSQRYYKLLTRLLKVTKLKYSERNLDYGKLNLKYNFEQAAILVDTLCQNLDPEFQQIFRGFLENGQIDVYPKKGKRSGAFCAGDLITIPTYILLNFTNELEDVLTIAHELGHGLNNELVRKKQGALDFGTPISTAEIASIFMEDFVMDEVSKTATDTQKFEIAIRRINRVVASLFRQLACYQFEQALHKLYREKGYLSKEEIGILFKEYMESYMGPAIEQPKEYNNWWIYWTHIRSYFYNYAYGLGILVAKALQAMVREDPKNIEKVKYFLSAGLSDSPKNVFQHIGIDMTRKEFWEKGIAEVEELLTQAETLAKKLKKI